MKKSFNIKNIPTDHSSSFNLGGNEKNLVFFSSNNMKIKHSFTFVLLVLINILFALPLISNGQSPKKFIREGNKQYKDGQYNEAEIKYRKSLKENKESVPGTFNLGDALYKQGKYEEAADNFRQITGLNTDPQTEAKAYHNLGNSLLKSKKLEESIEAYKNALKRNPQDEDSRYNLAYAKTLLKQQQNQQNQNKKDNKDKDKNKDKNKEENKEDKGDEEKDDKNKKDKGKDEKDSQSKDSEGGEKAEDQDQKGAKPKNKISKEDAQRMLDALNQQEKDMQKKVQKKPAVRVEIEKNW